MKVVLSTVIGVLAILQVVGALWLYGKLGIEPPGWLGRAHRASGAVALVLTVFVAYHCLWALGLETGTVHGKAVPTRTVVHGVLGCAVIGALVVKVVAVRSRRASGWFLPVAGGLLFALLIGWSCSPRRSGTSARRGGRAESVPERPGTPSATARSAVLTGARATGNLNPCVWALFRHVRVPSRLRNHDRTTSAALSSAGQHHRAGQGARY